MLRSVGCTLSVLSQRLAVCRLPPGEAVPEWLYEESFFSVTRTEEELSVVLPEVSVPAGWSAERGWRCLKVRGPLDFGLTGILASLSAPLAEAEIPIFAVSTYNTDYILVRASDLGQAVTVLSRCGHVVEGWAATNEA